MMEATDGQILLDKKARLLSLVGLWVHHEGAVDVDAYLEILRKTEQIGLL